MALDPALTCIGGPEHFLKKQEEKGVDAIMCKNQL